MFHMEHSEGLGGRMFHVKHREWTNPGRVFGVSRGEIHSSPAVPALLWWLADDHDSPVHDPGR